MCARPPKTVEVASPADRRHPGVADGSQLAEASGLTQRAISYYETMPGYPGVPTIIALARALRVSADELLGLKALPRALSVSQPPEEKRLWKKFRQLAQLAQLPERDKRAVLRMIDTATLATQAR